MCSLKLKIEFKKKQQFLKKQTKNNYCGKGSDHVIMLVVTVAHGSIKWTMLTKMSVSDSIICLLPNITNL